MARVIISPENQIQRINALIIKLQDFEKIPLTDLQKKPHEKAWNSIEVLRHMVIGHNAYREKIDTTIQKLPVSSDQLNGVKSRSIPSFLIKRFPPIEGEIKFKMKTGKIFEPSTEMGGVDLPKEFAEMQDCLIHLYDSVQAYRLKQVEKIKFNSAIGPVVRFNVAEACEFILCHNERHFRQIENNLADS